MRLFWRTFIYAHDDDDDDDDDDHDLTLSSLNTSSHLLYHLRILVYD